MASQDHPDKNPDICPDRDSRGRLGRVSGHEHHWPGWGRESDGVARPGPKRMAKQPAKKKTVETLTHDADKRRNIPTAEYQSAFKEEQQSPIRVAYERRNRDLDPQLVWRGKDEQDWSDLRRSRAAAVHPGKSSPQGADRQLAEAIAARERSPTRPVCGLQQPPRRRRQDRLLSARPELVQPHDPR